MDSKEEADTSRGESVRQVIRVPLIDLEDAVDAAFKTGLTPLIVDTSEEDRVCTFYSYQSDATLLEAKQIILKGLRSPSVEHLEPFRRSLVNAMKYGKLLVIRMADAAPSLYSKWNDEAMKHNNDDPATAYFPADIFFEGGKRLHGTNWPYRLFREADMFPHKNLAYCLDNFRLCFTSQFSLDDIDEFLFETEALPPRENFQIIYIEPEIEKK